jgi:sec-independent protein translocase protein TatA
MLEKLFEKHPQPHCQTRFKSTTHIPQNKTHEVKKSKNLHPHPIYDVNPSLQTQQPKLSSRPISPKMEKKKKTLIMEISSITLSFPKPPPCLPFSSSQSTFFNTTAFFNKSSKSYNSLVLGKTRSRSQRAKKGLTCNALFGLGVPELVVIAGVAALVFGPKKLPEVGKSIGKTVRSFQQVSGSSWLSLVFK